MDGRRLFVETEQEIDDGWWSSVLAEEEKFHEQSELENSRSKNNGLQVTQEEWMKLKDCYQFDRVLNWEVSGFNKGGLLLEKGEIRGFIPCSHLSRMTQDMNLTQRMECLAGYVGMTLPVKIIECSPEENRLIFSERAARSRSGVRIEIIDALTIGDTVTGEVTNITDFGVFVDLGGVEGLVHLSELSWGRVTHPRQVVCVGEKVNVMVLKVQVENCRVALSLKRLKENPWEQAKEKYLVGQDIKAVITTTTSFGAFACLDDGLEGLIHKSEYAIDPMTNDPIQLVSGQEVRARVKHVDVERQRLGLTMRDQVELR